MYIYSVGGRRIDDSFILFFFHIFRFLLFFLVTVRPPLYVPGKRRRWDDMKWRGRQTCFGIRPVGRLRERFYLSPSPRSFSYSFFAPSVPFGSIRESRHIHSFITIFFILPPFSWPVFSFLVILFPIRHILPFSLGFLSTLEGRAVPLDLFRGAPLALCAASLSSLFICLFDLCVRPSGHGCRRRAQCIQLPLDDPLAAWTQQQK